MHRAINLQAAVVDHQLDHDDPEINQTYASIHPASRTSLAIGNARDNWELLNRHETRMNRLFRHSLAMLRSLQACRKNNSAGQTPELTETSENGHNQK